MRVNRLVKPDRRQSQQMTWEAEHLRKQKPSKMKWRVFASYLRNGSLRNQKPMR